MSDLAIERAQLPVRPPAEFLWSSFLGRDPAAP
jgi:hypothetical protein